VGATPQDAREPGGTREDRALLARFAPRLQYDAQDAYRAVAAQTMTDNEPNALRRADRSVIARGAQLDLGTLVRYPGEVGFRPGDHLAAGPELLQDAVRMQRDPGYPHCAYGRVLRGPGSRTWLQYWLWYYDNPKTFLGRGRHQGDWELVQVGLDGEEPALVTLSQHGSGETRAWSRVERALGAPKRPLVFVAPFSHANYFEPRTTYALPAADHPTRQGPARDAVVLPFGAWEAWGGRWGADRGPLGGRARWLGGASPEAPGRQEGRWTRPGAFCARSRRPVARAVKAAIWSVGRLSYPRAPELVRARLEDEVVVLEHRLPSRRLLRARHLLVTLHEPGEEQHMLLSAVIRLRPDSGALRLRLPRPVPACVVWASAFNRLGQRSTVAGPLLARAATR